MVKVIEVDLGLLGIRFPRGQVGMVIAQPYVKFTGNEPFTLLPETLQRAFECIDETLAVARRCVHGAEKTHFTIFPECTLPGLEGIERVTEALTQENWPAETVVIGGVDGLTRIQFAELLQRPNTVHDPEGNGLDRMRDDQWVNCCVIWVKLPTGEVSCWVQPKLAPAWVELDVNHQSMYKGRSIFLFKGTYADYDAPYQFATLLCFDWIGSSHNLRMWQWLLQGINIAAAERGAVLPLTWLFVAQCNEVPSHASFMGQVGQFFDSAGYPRVHRANTCLVMANVAGRATPGKAEKYGRSAVIFTPDRLVRPDCMPTYCNGGETQRAGNPLENFRDAVFRERGACIHSFLVQNPEALPPGSAGRMCALTDATVHPFVGTIDPRAPSGLVPAVIKWVNDDLDDGRKSLAAKHPAFPLAGAAGIAHQNSVAALRRLSANSLSKTMLVASTGTNNDNPDSWTEQESLAVSHIVQTFSILEVADYPPTFHGHGAQATIQNGGRSLEVVAVLGSSHEECDKHVMEKVVPHRGQLLMISRDDDNTPWDPRLRTIFDQVADDTTEYVFTDPRSAVIRVGYHDILQAYRESANEAELNGAIDAAIT